MAKNWTDYEGEMNVVPGTILEEDSLFDIRDDKWAHPELKEGWYTAGSNCTPLYDPNVTLEEKQAKQEELQKEIFAVSEKLYKAANPQGAEGAPTGDAGQAYPNVYEADFTDVEDNK